MTLSDAVLLRIAACAMGSLFVAIGWRVGRMTPGGWMGVYTPWTAASPRVWTRTQQLARDVMIGAGVLMVLAGLLFEGDLALTLVLSLAAGAWVSPVLYSYLAWRRERTR